MRSWSLRSEHYRSSLSNRQRGLWINQWLHPYSRYWRRYSRYLFWIWLQGSGLSWLCASPPPVASLILLAQISVNHTQGRDCRVPQGYSEGMLGTLVYQPSSTSGWLCINPALIVSSINSGMMDGGLEGRGSISWSGVALPDFFQSVFFWFPITYDKNLTGGQLFVICNWVGILSEKTFFNSRIMQYAW